MLPGLMSLDFCYSIQMLGSEFWSFWQHESMDPPILVSIITVWQIFSWYPTYLSIVANDVHPFMTTVYDVWMSSMLSCAISILRFSLEICEKQPDTDRRRDQ